MNPFTFQTTPNVLFENGACAKLPDIVGQFGAKLTYLQNRFFRSASRYTTSALMRLKLGERLKEREVAPHVFETRAEAHESASRGLE